MSHRVKCFLLHFSTNWAILSLLRHTFFCDFLFLSFAQLCFVSEWLPTRILNGVYSLFSANYCSNPFEIFFIFTQRNDSHYGNLFFIPEVCGNVAWKRIIITLKGRMFYVWLSLVDINVVCFWLLFRPRVLIKQTPHSEISKILV